MEEEMVRAPLYDHVLNAVALLEMPKMVAEQINKLPANWLRVHLQDESIVVVQLGWITSGIHIATMFTIDNPDKPMPGQLSQWKDMTQAQQEELLERIPAALLSVCQKLVH